MLARLVQASLPDGEQARKARWLNRLLLSFAALGIAQLGVTTLLLPWSITTLADAGAVVLVLGLYTLNRRGRVTAALLGLLAILVAVVLQAGFSVPDLAGLAYPALFVLVIVSTGVFLSGWAVLGTVVVVSAITVWYYLASPAPSVVTYRSQDPQGLSLFMYTLVLLFLGAGALSWLSSRMIGETVGDLRRRAADLEMAYRTLTTQSEREHAMGTNIGSLASELSTVSTRQAQGVATQAHAIAQVGAAVTELQTTAQQIMAGAQQVRDAAARARESVIQAQTLVAQSHAAVERNRGQVQMVIARMTTLDRLTAQITTLINGIRNLSDETQLLALNATIEAAGAGAVGRRFGVVADEVQMLARRSDALVAQIHAALDALRQAGQEAQAATESGLGVADEVQHLAQAVQLAQGQAVDAVETTHALIQQIAASTGEQTQATTQVSRTMQQLAADATTTTQEMRALETVSGELLRAAALMSAISHLSSA